MTSSGRTRSSRRRARRPAPARSTRAGAPVNLRTYYDTLAAANPTLVKRVPYGTSLNGLELVAYRVTAGANTSAEGSKPGVMFHGAQHAREWISAEVVRRGFQYFLDHKDDAASGIPAILASTEVWFIPVLNPDGYDYTFQTRASRLWRKNLRDTNGNGTIASATASTPTATSRRSGATTTRARATRRRATPTAARRRSPSPRCRASTR